ncbi:MAG: hypothetical protein WAR24_09755 [Candidatus Acidiferrales bacterium]
MSIIGTRFISDAETIAEMDFSDLCTAFVKAERRFRNLDEHPDVVTDPKLNVCWWNAMEAPYVCDKALWEMFIGKDRSVKSNRMYNEFRAKLIAGKSLRADA